MPLAILARGSYGLRHTPCPSNHSRASGWSSGSDVLISSAPSSSLLPIQRNNISHTPSFTPGLGHCKEVGLLPRGPPALCDPPGVESYKACASPYVLLPHAHLFILPDPLLPVHLSPFPSLFHRVMTSTPPASSLVAPEATSRAFSPGYMSWGKLRLGGYGCGEV